MEAAVALLKPSSLIFKVWEDEGLSAIQRVARNDTSAFLRVAASWMPRDININGTIGGVSAETFVTDFRAALALLGNEPPESRRRTVGGCEIASAADFVCASTNARFAKLKLRSVLCPAPVVRRI